jgi:hypothetical protein
LREKLFGQGARLSEEHPGAAYRIQQEQAALA